MPIDKPTRRLPLRDLLTDAEKRTRDLDEQMDDGLAGADHRPARSQPPLRKTQQLSYLLALQNAIQNMVQIESGNRRPCLPF